MLLRRRHKKVETVNKVEEKTNTEKQIEVKEVGTNRKKKGE